MDTILTFIINKAKEPSTITGLVGLLGLVGVHFSVSPELAGAASGAVGAVLALALVIVKEHKPAA